MCACVRGESLQWDWTLSNPVDCSPPDSSAHGDSPGKNTGVGCPFVPQGIFATQGSDPRLLPLLVVASLTVEHGHVPVRYTCQSSTRSQYLWHMGFVPLWCVESSWPPGDRTRVPSIDTQSLNHWTAKEVLASVTILRAGFQEGFSKSECY